jgi:ketosteroid isomerase-like protein
MAGLDYFYSSTNFMRTILFFSLLFFSLVASAQQGEEKAIRQILEHQTDAWNNGDIEGFMQTYWKSDSLLFIGKNGVRRGWKETLENYKKGYPDKAAMGRLSFDLLEIRKLSAEYYYVVGKWMLARSAGDLSGHFDLLIRRLKGRWVIVSDHSS